MGRVTVMMNIIKNVIIVLIESLLLGYIVFALTSGYYNNYKWSNKNTVYYSRDLILSENIDVMLDTGEQVSIKQNEVIHSCAMTIDGYVIDAIYEPEPGKCLYLDEKIGLDMFVESESLKTDLKQLVEDKEKSLSESERKMIVELLFSFLVSLSVSILVMIFTRRYILIHCIIITILSLVAFCVFQVVGGGYII